MATVLDWFVGLSWFLNLVLDIGAAFYSYRLTKITGGFRAWWLIIVFTIVFVVNSFFSVEYGILAAVAGGTAGAATESLYGISLFSVVLQLLLSILLFTAMFELYRTFKRAQSPKS